MLSKFGYSLLSRLKHLECLVVRCATRQHTLLNKGLNLEAERLSALPIGLTLAWKHY
ncbi:hypothetical protein FDUTEX481_05543 [Tolypothrix sp. PCC 7601]|nr:hypothetical protein FDUTEX481_05543 [Tolypothrix sp. PCC 7601]